MVVTPSQDVASSGVARSKHRESGTPLCTHATFCLNVCLSHHQHHHEFITMCHALRPVRCKCEGEADNDVNCRMLLLLQLLPDAASATATARLATICCYCCCSATSLRVTHYRSQGLNWPMQLTLTLLIILTVLLLLLPLMPQLPTAITGASPTSSN